MTAEKRIILVLGIFIGMLLVAMSSGCTLPIVWEDPVIESTPVPPPDIPGIASTLPETQVVSTAVQTPEPPIETATIPPPTLTATATRLPFILQPGAPAAGINFAHPDRGCNWFGIAGQVLDFRGDPLEGLVIEVRGIIRGQMIESLAITGSAPLYGPGGYELTLGDHPVNSQDALRIQILDGSGTAVSEIFFLETFEDCDRNLILVNFIESPDFEHKWLIPMVFN